MWRFLPFDTSTRAIITCPRHIRDRLILLASWKRKNSVEKCWLTTNETFIALVQRVIRGLTLSLEPSVCVSFCLSEPARSTRFSWDVRMFTISFTVSLDSKVILKTACDLEDSRFMEVEATRRLRQPIDSTYIYSNTDTWREVNWLNWESVDAKFSLKEASMFLFFSLNF